MDGPGGRYGFLPSVKGIKLDIPNAKQYERSWSCSDDPMESLILAQDERWRRA